MKRVVTAEMYKFAGETLVKRLDKARAESYLGHISELELRVSIIQAMDDYELAVCEEVEGEIIGGDQLVQPDDLVR